MSARPPSLTAYRAATAVLEPLAPALLRGRARRGKEDPQRLSERLGRASHPRPVGPLVWLHGVSVGESLSLIPLIEALASRRPDLSLLVTSGTVTAAGMLAKRLPAGVIHQYAPIDGPAAVGRFVDHWRPALGVMVESDLWPNLILAARERGARMALISALMTEKSASGWARRPAAARALLSAFDLILPQDAETEARLRGLGATTGPRLNLKRIGDPLPFDAVEAARLRETIGERPVVLAASTHPGEDAPIVQAVFEAAPGALLVLAPRHPARADAIAQDLAGHAIVRRSGGGDPTTATAVYLADTLGEMGLMFELADVVVMGGSFVTGIGGHNPLEPARAARPIVSGPHVHKNAALYGALYAEGAAIAAADATALARHVAGLIAYPAIARRTAQAARVYALRQNAALDQALDLLQPLLPT